jgi:DNA repair exonuclease SbcCD ATPase subunit
MKKTILTIIAGSFALLSACSGESTEEQIHSHLEEAVAQEAEFEEQQGQITDLEQREQELYSEIIQLSMDEFEQIQTLSQEALEVIDERSDKISQERESIESSQETFQMTEELIAELDEGIQAKGEEMYNVMGNRYAAYYDLFDTYVNSLELERELYEMLQQEDTEQEALNEQINSINESYQSVLGFNEQFNEYTVEYNDLKQEFYNEADINVTYEENETKEESEEDEEN